MKKSCVQEVRTWMDARCLTCAIPNTHQDMEAMDKCVQPNVQPIVTMMKQCVLAELWMDVRNLITVSLKTLSVLQNVVMMKCLVLDQRMTIPINKLDLTIVCPRKMEIAKTFALLDVTMIPMCAKV